MQCDHSLGDTFEHLSLKQSLQNPPIFKQKSCTKIIYQVVKIFADFHTYSGRLQWLLIDSVFVKFVGVMQILGFLTCIACTTTAKQANLLLKHGFYADTHLLFLSIRCLTACFCLEFLLGSVLVSSEIVIKISEAKSMDTKKLSYLCIYTNIPI